jgi:hypothetical protein
MSDISIAEKVRTLESNYINGTGTLMSKYVVSDLYEDTQKIYAYLNSRHVSGSTDALGREKPFFNIVLSARNIYFRATDIDRKNIEITPSKSKEVVPALLATIHLQNWMKKEDFGTFLNNWGLDLAGFNSNVVKFVEKNGELHPMVVPWSRLIVDPINFDKNYKIEVIELTEDELYQREGYNKDIVEKLCDAVKARELLDGTPRDERTGYIKLYEVHGVMPLSYITGKDKDDDTYEQQMHVLSFVEAKESGKFDEFTLYAGREENDPYMLTALLPATDGSVSLDGSVKNLFEAQWMMNHTAKSIKDQLDVASKLIFQTSDANYVGRNVLSSLEQGDIMIHAVNEPLTQMNNSSHDITAQQNFSSMWKGLASEINGVSESMMGNAAPSGTAWRQVEALLQESHSLFELMTENKGLYLEQMLRRFVIPFLKKKMNTSEEIAATLESHNISQIDAMYVPAEAVRRYNKEAVSKVISALENDDMSQLPEEYNPEQAQQQVKQELAPLGSKRFFKPSEISTVQWSEIFKDMEWNININITGEAKDANSVMTTLSTALQAVVNPAYANNPQAQLIVSKILSATGAISPLEIASMPAPQPPPIAPQPMQ